MRHLARPRGRGRAGARGIVLPTVLLVLLVLTLLGTAAVFTASTDADIAGNGRRELEALSLAEAGIQEAIARLNIRDPAHARRITPGVSPLGSTTPDASWSMTIVSGTPGANETQTVTASADPATALPVRTEIRYKRESATEQPTFHCDGPTTTACDGQVVLFQDDFHFPPPAPVGSRIGPPVLFLRATYDNTANRGAFKVLEVELVRSVTYANSPAALRACGNVDVTGSTITSGTDQPDGNAIYAGGTVTQGGAANVSGNSVGGQTCSGTPPGSQLFESTFGMTQEELRSAADIVQPVGYNPPSGTVDKVIFITGAGLTSWQGNAIYGSVNEPVIVVVEGDFKIAGTTEVFGVIYVTGNLTLGAGTPRIHGAMVVQGNATTEAGGNFNLTYNPDVMDKIPRLTPFTTLSWRAS